MRRQGDYSEYCGTKARLPVFVTTNSRLIVVALDYRSDRKNTSAINGWKQNRLPVITDIRLTCRLWLPATQSERMSLLYLSANAVAAKRPTRRYLNSIRELAIQLRESVPEYSGICLPAYFDDNVTDVILEQTHGAEERLNIGIFVSSIAELTECKAKEEEIKTKQAIAERDIKADELNQQTRDIIEGAVDENKNSPGLAGIWLRIPLWWPVIVTGLFAGISAIASCIFGNMHVCWVILGPIILAVTEEISASDFIKKFILRRTFPKAEVAFEKRIIGKLRKAELPHKDAIIQQAKEQGPLWIKCKKIMED